MRYEYEDVSLYYEVHGTGQPVLLLHGRPMDSRAMRAIFEPILAERPGYQRIYVDLPGMGRTGASEAIQNLDYGSWIASSHSLLAMTSKAYPKILCKSSTRSVFSQLKPPSAVGVRPK